MWLHWTKKFLHCKGNCLSTEEAACRMGQKFTNYAIDRGLILRSIKYSRNLITAMQTIQLRTGISIFSKDEIQIANRNMKKIAQGHLASRKCKSKPQWYITSPQLEWL